jgi:hypothetical protein
MNGDKNLIINAKRMFLLIFASDISMVSTCRWEVSSSRRYIAVACLNDWSSNIKGSAQSLRIGSLDSFCLKLHLTCLCQANIGTVFYRVVNESNTAE